jgi:hypothetical protein
MAFLLSQLRVYSNLFCMPPSTLIENEEHPSTLIRECWSLGCKLFVVGFQSKSPFTKGCIHYATSMCT